jgi:hypothetical protein
MGQTKVEVFEISGCTPSSWTDENVDNVHQVIHKDRHVLLAVFVTF